MERSLPIQKIRRLGFREQAIPWPKTNLGPGNFAKIYPPCRAERRDSETIRMVAVGTILADRPPQRSVRAELLHTAPTSDE